MKSFRPMQRLISAKRFAGLTLLLACGVALAADRSDVSFTSLASAQSLASDRPRAGPVAEIKPVLACHEPKLSAPPRPRRHR